jgi:hypothetical protein
MLQHVALLQQWLKASNTSYTVATSLLQQYLTAVISMQQLQQRCNSAARLLQHSGFVLQLLASNTPI